MFLSGNININDYGHEPMTIGNTKSYLEEFRQEPIFDYRELGNDLSIFLCVWCIIPMYGSMHFLHICSGMFLSSTYNHLKALAIS
jgi:hypothetical protein